MQPVILKVGGSLLSLPDLAERLRRVVDHFWQLDQQPVLVVGGGEAADTVRSWDGVHQLDEPAAHWLAVRSLDMSAELLSQLIPEVRLVTEPSQLVEYRTGRELAVVNCLRLLRAAEGTGNLLATLPRSWNVTSDSIAAAVAAQWRAAGLVLVKSLDIPTHCSPTDAAAAGWIDGFLPQLLIHPKRNYAVAWCNLRSDQPHLKTVFEIDSPVDDQATSG